MLVHTKKIIFVIILAILPCFLFGCSNSARDEIPVETMVPVVESTFEPTPEPTPVPTPEPTPPIAVSADGTFTMYGEAFNLNDRVINLSHVEVSDNGELVMSMMPFMKNLQILDMDSCGVDSEHMAVIRDAFPDVEVIWRIWFGSERNYSVRTDVTRILASNSGPNTPGGTISHEDALELKYCTKVKLLDLGHTESMPDISFIQYMPDLEVAVLAMGTWCDATPLSYCKNLEYAELQTTGISDLTPLSECKNLKHLNICHDFGILDLSPIFGLDLTRLWLGAFTPVPRSQIEEYQSMHPNCKINTTALDPTIEGWRTYYSEEAGTDVYDPRYEILRQQFEYDASNLTGGAYSFYWNDPLYDVPKEY